MSTPETNRLRALDPETKARLDAAREASRAKEEAVRAQFADKPSFQDLIDRGEIDPPAVTAGNVGYALLRAAAGLKRERERQGLSLADLAGRTSLAEIDLSRLEDGRNVNPKLETISIVAGALGLEVGITLTRTTSRYYGFEIIGEESYAIHADADKDAVRARYERELAERGDSVLACAIGHCEASSNRQAVGKICRGDWSGATSPRD